MDFSFSEEQEAIRGLARQILEDRLTPERLRAIERSDDLRFDRETWSELAKANLLGVGLPEEVGGSGLGFVEVAVLLEEVGRTVAPLPLYPTLVLGALPVARFGNEPLRKALLPGVVAGETVLTAALVETGTDPRRPVTTARRDGGRWVLDGTKVCVPAGLIADHILVSASTPDGGVGVFVVDAGAAGVVRRRQETTTGIPEALIELQGAAVRDDGVLGAPSEGAAVLDWMLDRATAGLCAMAVGVCDRALRMTAEYTKTREQFDRPIATFQAVGQRAADAYIDTEAVRLTAWQAVWRLSEELPAAAEVAVAKFWAAEGGQRVVHAAQHLHGGIGVDRDYPLHRYFLWAKWIELSLGGATQQLLRLGSMLAAEPA
jgi:alkylation response protein AidB-like acyl-CoA dehydrogenase